MHIYTPAEASRALPIIDIGGADASHIATAIHRACRETGFFYIVNHAVPAELIADQFTWSERFFALPIEEKMALAMHTSPSRVGYEPVGAQVLDSQDDTAEKAPPDLKESFYCGVDLPEDHPLLAKHWRGYGHNRWPASLPGFAEQTLALHRALQLAGDRVLSLLAQSLELAPGWFEPFYRDANASLRLIKYPPHPTAARANQLGAGTHTDWGGVTLLAQDDVGGLEVQNVAGNWIAAPPIAGALVVNLGDLMARWTNGVYRSNFHRVRNNSTARDRFSLAYFYGPRPDAVIAPIATCVSDDLPQRFEPCTADDHMQEMFRRSYGYSPVAA